MPGLNEVIGLDIGHSTVKGSYCTQGGIRKKLFFPSVVSPAFPISDEGEARRARAETVRVAHREFFIGDTAITQAGASGSTGLSEDWIETPEHSALLLGALQKIRADGGLDDLSMLVLGLPTNLFLRGKDRLKEIAGEFVDQRVEIKVIPQPVGAYQCSMLGETGIPARSIAKESWAVVEVGYYTTDFALLQNGRWTEKASGSCAGVRVAAEMLVRLLAESRNMTVDLLECEEALRTNEIRAWGQRVDVSAEVAKAAESIIVPAVDNAVRLMEPFARKIDGVLVAGGGAPMVFPPLKERWPHAQLLPDPRFAVSEGMRRFGMAMLRANEQLRSAAA